MVDMSSSYIHTVLCVCYFGAKIFSNGVNEEAYMDVEYGFRVIRKLQDRNNNFFHSHIHLSQMVWSYTNRMFYSRKKVFFFRKKRYFFFPFIHVGFILRKCRTKIRRIILVARFVDTMDFMLE